MMIERWQKAGFGLYIHWPFCMSKCPYCDFNSHVADVADHGIWEQAFQMELARLYDEIGPRRLSSIFFGGGTPSLMPAKLVEKIITTSTGLWPAANDIEITLEANPTSVEAGKFRDFRQAGVNRVSIGVQSLHDQDLRRLGRLHDADEARRALKIAANTFDRFSFDLIYARQDQTLLAWERELVEAIAIGSDHLSLYQLTIEPGTVFGERFAKGMLRGIPDENTGADMYVLTQEICDAHGLRGYEISNHARAGAESVHNMIYWTCGDYGGIGPGAHGRLTMQTGERWATESHRQPGKWLSSVVSGGCGYSSKERLSREEMAEEYLVMGLRLSNGIDCGDMAEFTSFAPSEAAVSSIAEMGLVIKSGQVLKTTERGRMLLNAILQNLTLVDLEKIRL